MKTFSGILVALCFALTCSVASALEDNMMMSTSTPIPTSTINTSKFSLDNSNSNMSCFVMSAAFQLNIRYIASDNKSMSRNFTLGSDGVLDMKMSTCNTSALLANISVKCNDTDEPPFYILFDFVGNKKDQQWRISDIQVKINTSYLTRYPNANKLEVFDAIGDEITKTEVEYERSFKCSAEQDVNFNTTKNPVNIFPVLSIQSFQVQVFIFKNTTSNDFGNGRLCSMDANKGSKTVPIAVGAALAALVVVVLIAYLVGRLKSRRQSSYEALS